MFISAASVWEIAIKQAVGKLSGLTDLLDVVERSGLVKTLGRYDVAVRPV